jgi:hypothetical protein
MDQILNGMKIRVMNLLERGLQNLLKRKINTLLVGTKIQLTAEAVILMTELLFGVILRANKRFRIGKTRHLPNP